MNAHVETRQISARDWMWSVRGWLGEVMAYGHCPSKKEAMVDGRASKKYLLAQLKKAAKNGAPKKKR